VDPAGQTRVEAAHSAHDVDALEVLAAVLFEDLESLRRILVGSRRTVVVPGAGVPRVEKGARGDAPPLLPASGAGRRFIVAGVEHGADVTVYGFGKPSRIACTAAFTPS
jgi:hypothetical protein